MSNILSTIPSWFLIFLLVILTAACSWCISILKAGIQQYIGRWDKGMEKFEILLERLSEKHVNLELRFTRHEGEFHNEPRHGFGRRSTDETEKSTTSA